MAGTYQHVREMIRTMQGYLQSPGNADAQFVRDESVEYNDLCHEVNVRLSEVASLIDRGLREDAIEISTVNGDLLELFKILDFPERESWCELINQFGFQLPPPLDYESGTKLNSSHAIVAELTPILRKHRLLNLSRAPLSQRIVSLQRLHSKDPGNPIWPANGAELQKARIEQMREQVAQAVEIRDITTLHAIDKEIDSSIWWVDVPTDLKTKVKHTKSRFRNESQRSELLSQLQSLQQAYAAFDVSEAITIADQVRRGIEKQGFELTDPLIVDAQPALSWVDDQLAERAKVQRVANLTGSLETALDRHADRNTLARSLAAAEGLGEQIPVQLLQRGRERIESFEMIARRRTMLGIAVGVLALIAAGGGIGFVVMQQREATRIAELESTLDELLQAEKFEAAENFLNAIDAPTQNRAAFLAGRGTINEAIQANQKRTDAFNQVLDELKADRSGRPNYALISRLRKLAKTEEENNELALQEARAEDLRLQEKASTGAANSQALKAMQTKMDAFFQRPVLGEARLSELQQLRVEVASLVSRFQTSDVESATTASQLGKLLEAEENRVRRTLERDEGLVSITQSVGSFANYVAQTNRFIEQHPNDPTSIGLASVPAMGPLIDASQAWIDVLSADVYRTPADASVDSIITWLDLVTTAKKIAPDHPWADKANPLIPHLQSAITRSTAIQDLKNLIATPLLQERMFIYTEAGTESKYYSPMSPDQESATPHVVSYYADPLLLKQSKNFGLRYETQVLPGVVQAGHTQWAMATTAMLRSLDDKNFTPTCYRLLTKLHEVDGEKIDPIFRGLLMRSLLEIIAPASEPIRVGFESLIEKFNSSDVDWTSNWLSPLNSDPQVDRSRDAAVAVYPTALNWKARTEQMKTSFQTLREPRSFSPQWVGWVVRANDQWKVMISESLMGDNDSLVVILRENDRYRMEPLDRDRTSQSITNPKAQSVGLPVYRL